MREMKDSGIEWIGEIPNSWTVRRGKTLFVNTKYIPGKLSSNYDRLSLTLKGVLPRKKDDSDGLQPKDFDTYQLLRENELVFKLIDLQNVSTSRVGLAHATGLVSPAYIVLHANEEILPAFAEKFYLMMWYREIFNSLGDNGVRSSLNVRDLLNIPVCYPKMEEQIFLTNYLDTKCSEIDAIAEDIQKQISVLEDYKKSVITEAVTKGLNPDVEMKDSGIFYLGPINKSWTMNKIGYCCFKLNRKFYVSDEALICSNKGKVLVRGDNTLGLMTSEDNAMQGIIKGDIAIHGMDTWHGAIACSDFNGKITRVVHVCKSKGDNRFVVYWLQHLAFLGVYKLISNGVRGNTSDFRSWDKVANIAIPWPDDHEQKIIADYLDELCLKVESIITDKKKQLEILSEYKKSLIYEYVTGKKEVPES